MATRTIYRGFSSLNWLKHRTFTLTNAELVKRDILNHIFTEQGSRYHMPAWGTRIPSITFEPNDDRTLQIIREDLQKVFDYDPRVKLLNLQLLSIPDNNAIVAVCDFLYIELNFKDTLKIEFPFNE